MTRFSTLIVSALSAVLLISATSASAQQFVRDAAALSSPATWTNGVVAADLDGDGDEDLAFANGFDYGPGGARPQRLYLNDGAGNFSDASAQLNVANFNAQMLIADDADNDGDLDLIYAPAGAFPATTERARILINDGNAVFSDESAARMPLATMSAWSVVAFDFDNDGDRDLAINDGCLTFMGQPAQARLFENDGTGNYRDVTASRAPVEIYNGQDMIAFDYDGDWDLDLAFSGFGTPGKRSSLWLNDGSGHFSVDATLDNLCTANTYEADWSDLDGDGDWDACLMSIAGASEGWGENIGLGSEPFETVFSGPNADDDNELASFDYDNDGDLDVFIGSLSGNREKVYRQTAGVFTRVNIFQAISDSTLDFSFADFDDDGRHDVVTAQGESGVQINKIYDNNGPVDTLPPRVLDTEQPLAIVAGGQTLRIFAQDAWVDDGISNVLVSFAWETFSGGAAEASGSSDAGFMGGGMHRALVPTTALSDGLRLTWTLSDDVGNVADPVVVEVGNVVDEVWADFGSGLAGLNGVPLFTGVGPLTGGSNNAVELTGALPNGTTNLVLGLSQINAPFKGGTMVPALDILRFNLPLDAAGAQTIPFVWPLGVPSGFEVFLQHWIADAGGPVGFAASNGLRATAP